MIRPYTGVYVFGDSLVDGGNALKLAKTYDSLPFASFPDGAPSADRGYYQGRFSDGLTFADLISNKAIGVPTKPVFPFGFSDPWLGISNPFSSDPKGNNLNFAYGGSQIRKGSESVPDLDDQTDAWRDAVDGDADPGALHLFTVGGNDVRELVTASGRIVDRTSAQRTLQKAANELIEEVRQVIEDGARHVVVTGIPDIGSIPYYNGLVDESARRAAATEYSTMLDTMIRSQLSKLPLNGVDFRYVSLTSATNDIIGDLTAAGLYDSAIPLSRSGLFFDAVHPTAQAHALLAGSMLETIGGTFAGDAAPLKNADFAVRSAISTPGEIDTLVFSLAANTTYSFEMLGISSGKPQGLESGQVLADPSVRLLGPNGVVVAADDDGGLGLDARLQLTTSQAGSYTLELRGVGSLSGSYLVQAENHSVGDDSYYVASGSTLIIEGAGSGTDWVFAATNYTLAAGAEVEVLLASSPTGTEPLSLTGNEIANQIFGNDGANVLDGSGGDDVLAGFGGEDTLIGGSGNDLFVIGTDAANGASGQIDSIADYDAGDVIDLSQILPQLPGGITPTGGGYVHYQSGSGALQVDVDGGGDGFVTVAMLNGTPSAATVRYQTAAATFATEAVVATAQRRTAEIATTTAVVGGLLLAVDSPDAALAEVPAETARSSTLDFPTSEALQSLPGESATLVPASEMLADAPAQRLSHQPRHTERQAEDADPANLSAAVHHDSSAIASEAAPEPLATLFGQTVQGAGLELDTAHLMQALLVAEPASDAGLAPDEASVQVALADVAASEAVNAIIDRFAGPGGDEPVAPPNPDGLSSALFADVSGGGAEILMLSAEALHLDDLAMAVIA